MKAACRFILFLISVTVLRLPAFGQMPQDYWYVERMWGSYGTGTGQFSAVYGVALDTNGLIYVGDYNSSGRIQVFQADGSFVRKWNSLYSTAIAVGTNGLVYVVDQNTHNVTVFESGGTLVRQWGGMGSSDGKFSGPYGIALGANGMVYVADSGNHRIQVFQPNGTFVRKWGVPGVLDGQFSNPQGVAVDTNGLVYVADSGNRRVQIFQPDGTFVSKWGSSGSGDGQFSSSIYGIAVGENSLVYVADASYARIQVFQADGTFAGKWGVSGSRGGQFNSPRGIAVGLGGRVYVADTSNNRIQVFQRGYRAPASGIPLPDVTVSQRVGVAYVDIDYTIWDTDSSNVQVAVLGLTNSVVSLANVIRLDTLIEGTSNSVGTNISANVPHRITWNAAADWPVSSGNMKFEVLANDGRPMVDFHFITIPSNGPDPELEIERFPMKEADFQHCWYWLVATHDPAIDFKTNKVYGVSGLYADKLLAQSAGTTADGRDFLYERLNVRLATTAEVSRVRAGTTGVTNQWTPRVFDRRTTVNEFGFDSAYTQGSNVWYVVPLP
jgi:sugar lactone lactonase YvrE